MSSTTHAGTVDPADACALITSRTLAATPERVFTAFADAAQLARWWGPDGFSTTIHAFDFRPGGLMRLTMHGPDGTDYPDQALRFGVVEPASRVVLVHETPPWFELSLALHADPAGTRLDWRQRFSTPEQCAQLAPICLPANEQNLDRMEAVLRGG